MVCRAQVGLKKPDKRKGIGYNQLERLWIRNYERRNPKCNGREIHDDFNATFAGAMLLGETQPCPKRSMAAIACLRLRIPDDAVKSGSKRTAREAELETGDSHRDDADMKQDEGADKGRGGHGGEQET